MAVRPATYDLKSLAEKDMYDPIDKEILEETLGKDPFTVVSGAINIRDIGALASPNQVRRGLVYRSGALNKLPASSLTQLKDGLGIKMILDLRAEYEVTRSPDPAIEGVKNMHFDSSRIPAPFELHEFVANDGRDGYVKRYEEVLEIHGPSIRAALEWLRDEKSPILFHCTAGKDRTGVLAAVILSLAGVPADIVAYDYSLSRIGVEPSRELLLQMLITCNKDWTPETPGMKEFSQAKAEFMLGTLEMMEKKYGGAEGYARGLGFGDEDLEVIRSVLKGH